MGSGWAARRCVTWTYKNTNIYRYKYCYINSKTCKYRNQECACDSLLCFIHIIVSFEASEVIRYNQIISHTTRSGMRCILTSIGLAALACLHLTEAFAPSASKRSVSLSVAKTEEPCAIPSDFQDASTSLVNVPNSFKSIRSGMVTNSAGELIRLGDVISKNEPHVVIFLRHMG